MNKLFKSKRHSEYFRVLSLITHEVEFTVMLGALLLSIERRCAEVWATEADTREKIKT